MQRAAWPLARALLRGQRYGAAAPFSTSLLFGDTQIQFKESVAQFARENIAPHAAKVDATNNFPKEMNLWKLMGISIYMASQLPYFDENEGYK